LFEADLDPSSPGDATAVAALDRQLRAFVDQYGSGEIITLRDGVGEVIHEALASLAGEVGVVLVVERPDGTREARMYGVGSEDPIAGGCPLLLRADL
jgi:hypothetical protein